MPKFIASYDGVEMWVEPEWMYAVQAQAAPAAAV